MILSFLRTVKPFLAICSIYVVRYHLTQTSWRNVCLSASPDMERLLASPRILTYILVFALKCICTYVVYFYKNGRFFYFRGANMCIKTVIGFMEISSLKNFNHHKPLLVRKLGLFINLSSSFGTLVAHILPDEIRRTKLKLPLQ